MAEKEMTADKLQEKMCEKFEQLFQKHFHNSVLSQDAYVVEKLQAFNSDYLATLRER